MWGNGSEALTSRWHRAREAIRGHKKTPTMKVMDDVFKQNVCQLVAVENRSGLRLENVAVEDLVFLVQQGALLFHWRFGLRESHDGDSVTGVDEVGGRPVNDNLSVTRLTLKDISFKACAIGDGGDQDFLSWPEVHRLHEIQRNGDAAFIINVGISDGSAMEFGL